MGVNRWGDGCGAGDREAAQPEPQIHVCYCTNVAAHRNERVAENLREELDELIAYELSDPRIGEASVAEVLISPDFRHAHVRLTLGGPAEEQTATLEGLQHAKPFLKQQLSRRLQLHHMPELHFEAALPAELAAKAGQILKRIRRGRPKE